MYYAYINYYVKYNFIPKRTERYLKEARALSELG